MKNFFGIFLIITLTYALSQVPQKNSTISDTKTNNTREIKKEELVAEAGGKIKVLPTLPTKGREGYSTSSKIAIIPIVEPPSTKPTVIEINSTVTNSDHRSIGRKGVDFEKPNDDKVAAKPKKPTVTIPGNEVFPPSHFESSKSNTSSKLVSQVPNVDILNDTQDDTQKYIVPIIIVILSVPFVAILISIVYKRGAEWWRYRHYRRMDFLINGMYDN